MASLFSCVIYPSADAHSISKRINNIAIYANSVINGDRAMEFSLPDGGEGSNHNVGGFVVISETFGA